MGLMNRVLRLAGASSTDGLLKRAEELRGRASGQPHEAAPVVQTAVISVQPSAPAAPQPQKKKPLLPFLAKRTWTRRAPFAGFFTGSPRCLRAFSSPPICSGSS